MNGVEIVAECGQDSGMRDVNVTVVVAFAGLLSFGWGMALSGCGSDHTAGVVFDDGSDSKPEPTPTPPGGAANFLSLPTPTVTPEPG